MLRGPTAAAGANATPAAQWPLDFGRWVLGELVVRRYEPFAATLRPPAKPSRVRRDAAHGDSIWAETQPCWHE
ncbi:MAG: hypothetical protein ABI364_05265 [Caldimonas sp.]